ncbi:hypothetical protein [Mycobacteroides franklinii]|uniref:FtsK domain-containing protein n=1 Tax=Mycobacteroides franklinii TaxID=948102 RepID=A0A4R5PFQ1_9MYCO|nr:hypothetical protein [Mycobacteroides franklinii]ORA54187.1 hypothetical protein BST24_27015 [Mycobacteroides franklinii]TDH23885.1 hypothetical protein EJ571_06505 [Mycobacteroides franklinii]
MGIGQAIGRHFDRNGGLVTGTIARKLRGDVGYVERALEQAGEHRIRCVGVENGAYGTQTIVLSMHSGADLNTVKARGDLIAGFLGHDRVYGIKRRGGHVLLTIGPDRDFPSEREEYATVDGVDADLRVTHHESGRDAVDELAAGYPRFADSIGSYVEVFTTAGLAVKSVTKEPNPDGSACTVTTWTVPGFTHLHISPTGLLVALKGVPGQTLNTYRGALPHLVTAWNAKNLSVSEPEGGTYLLAFNDRDPLKGRDYRLQGPHRYDADAGRSLLGVGTDGREVWISWAGNAGLVIAGAPGTGKTASLLPVLAGMAGQAEIHLVDGKAMFDWEGISPICRTYIRSGKPDAPQEMLRRVYAASKRRGEAVYRLTGESNFWLLNRQQRRELGVTPVFIILDECQKFLDWSGMEKDEKAIVAANRKYIREMVQEGRSAGVVVILITQKPTSESIPTIIRDNAALRLSYYVRSSAAAIAVLGTGRGDGAPSPERDIKNGQLGRFVYDDTERGVAVLGQSFFLPGKEALPIMERWNPVVDQSDLADDLLRRAGISVDDVVLDVDEPAPTPKAKAPEVAEPAPEPEAPETTETPTASEPEPPQEPAVTVAEEEVPTDDPFAGL